LLKETPREKGCLYGCLGSFAIGGPLGGVLAYWVSGRFMGNPADKELYLIIRVGYSALGFLAGMIVWSFGSWIYTKLFLKEEEEDVI
jgi:hypothetical protein